MGASTSMRVGDVTEWVTKEWKMAGLGIYYEKKPLANSEKPVLVS